MRKVKRMFFDIETSPGVYWSFRCGSKVHLSYKNQLVRPAVICVAWRWEGESKVHSLTWDKNNNDRELLERFIPEMLSADEVIGHNSDNFDIKWLRTRALFHRLPMPPDFISYDTYKDARKYFNFDNNSLDFISDFLGVAKKQKVDRELWEDTCFHPERKVRDQNLKLMLKYCKQDVVSQSEVFEEFRPYVAVKAHRGDFISVCPYCGGADTREHKRRPTAQGYMKVQFQCFSPHPTKKGEVCGQYHTVAASRFDKDAKL